MLKKTMSSVCCVFILAGMSLALSGCVAKNAMSNSRMSKQNTEKELTVYGPPQVIYRIDNNRYLTLENYTRCENGQTFYNNKSKGIHTQISPSSGYLFKGRLFWLSTRDDRLAFPITRNDNKAVCMGSDKGCVNIISVTTNGGTKMGSVTYGANTQDPNGDTKYYDMLVNNDGFYLIEFSDGERVAEDGYVLKWIFDSDGESTIEYGYPSVTGPKHQNELPMDDISKVEQSRMQCDRTLEPVQFSKSKNQ